eukprot:g1858.t1
MDPSAAILIFRYTYAAGRPGVAENREGTSLEHPFVRPFLYRLLLREAVLKTVLKLAVFDSYQDVSMHRVSTRAPLESTDHAEAIETTFDIFVEGLAQIDNAKQEDLANLVPYFTADDEDFKIKSPDMRMPEPMPPRLIPFAAQKSLRQISNSSKTLDTTMDQLRDRDDTEAPKSSLSAGVDVSFIDEAVRRVSEDGQLRIKSPLFTPPAPSSNAFKKKYGLQLLADTMAGGRKFTEVLLYEYLQLDLWIARKFGEQWMFASPFTEYRHLSLDDDGLLWREAKPKKVATKTATRTGRWYVGIDWPSLNEKWRAFSKSCGLVSGSANNIPRVGGNLETWVQRTRVYEKTKRWKEERTVFLDGKRTVLYSGTTWVDGTRELKTDVDPKLYEASYHVETNKRAEAKAIFIDGLRRHKAFLLPEISLLRMHSLSAYVVDVDAVDLDGNAAKAYELPTPSVYNPEESRFKIVLVNFGYLFDGSILPSNFGPGEKIMQTRKEFTFEEVFDTVMRALLLSTWAQYAVTYLEKALMASAGRAMKNGNGHFFFTFLDDVVRSDGFDEIVKEFPPEGEDGRRQLMGHFITRLYDEVLTGGDGKFITQYETLADWQKSIDHKEHMSPPTFETHYTDRVWSACSINQMRMSLLGIAQRMRWIQTADIPLLDGEDVDELKVIEKSLADKVRHEVNASFVPSVRRSYRSALRLRLCPFPDTDSESDST